MNVLQASNEKIKYIFENFDNIYVSFSGGKDSGVMLNLVIDYMRANNITNKIGVFHIDYEAQYTMTTEYVDKVLSENEDIIEVYRCCVPMRVTTCTSMHQSYWRPWDPEHKELWVSELPKNCLQAEDFDFYHPDMWDYEFQEKFSEWIHKKNNATRTCCLVGIRTQESLHRWRAIHSDRNYKNYEGKIWTKTMFDNVYNAYPIYDWKTTDIWTANGKFGWSYNKLYDVFYQAGVGIEQQRVASPFLSTAQDSLKLYQVIEPNTWAKLLGRVNGVNFTGIYGGTTAMGWKSIKLPPNHTWKSYLEFLLNTLPSLTAQNYRDKLEISKKFWQSRGGCLSQETIDKLKSQGIPLEVVPSTNFKTDKLPVKMEYLDDIDITEFQQIPTYKRMCICIMKNDHLCKYMGFSLSKKELLLRDEATKKYQNIN
jgi:predicted phosphoadenosine phosphosulfate sulfurtransferase